MTKDEIKAMAIKCGFTLREQSKGRMDLNPYVYDFAERLIAAEREACAKIPLGFDIGEDRCNEIADAIRARSDK